MKNYFIALGIMIGFSFQVEAQDWKNIGKGLAKLTPIGAAASLLADDKADDTEDAPLDVNSAQDALIIALTDAMGDVLGAQALIAEAQGNAELAAKLNNTADKMKGGDVSNDDIKGAVLQSRDTASEQKDAFADSQQMTDESKALYAKAIVPYIKAAAKTAALKDPISDFMTQAQNSIKSIRNPMKLGGLKKTLDTGLFVGKNVPKLIITLGVSAKDLLTFAKKNELDTSGADDIEL